LFGDLEKELYPVEALELMEDQLKLRESQITENNIVKIKEDFFNAMAYVENKLYQLYEDKEQIEKLSLMQMELPEELLYSEATDKEENN